MMRSRSSAETVSRASPSADDPPVDAATARLRHRDPSNVPEPAASEPRRRFGGRFTWQRWHMVPVVAVVAVVVIVAGLISAPGTFPQALRLPVGQGIEQAFDALVKSGAWLYEPFAAVLTKTFDALVVYLGLISPPVFVAAVVLIVGYLKGVRLALLAAAMFTWVLLTGLWATTIQTVAFMAVAVTVSAILGVGLGLVAATNRTIHTAVRTLLDAMQAFPAFAYLVPIVFVFGMGNTGALVVTVIWAMPPIARMTNVGLRNVSTEVLEAGAAAGANRWQLLRGIKFPMAATTIRAGLNQTIMYAIAMATLAAMIGAEGLGAPVWSGVRRLELGDALEAGIALVLVAILIDRASMPRSPGSRHGQASRGQHSRRAGRFLRAPSPRELIGLAAFFVVVAATQIFHGQWQNFTAPPWGTPFSLQEPVDTALLWVTKYWGPGLDAVGASIQLFGLNQLGDFFGSIPWFVVVGCVAIIGVVVIGWIEGVALGFGDRGHRCPRDVDPYR